MSLLFEYIYRLDASRKYTDFRSEKIRAEVSKRIEEASMLLQNEAPFPWDQIELELRVVEILIEEDKKGC